MAVYRNYYYNRRTPLAWTAIVLVSCLYLLCSTATIGTVSCSMTKGEHLRHHHAKNQQSEKSSVSADDGGDGGRKSTGGGHFGCPNCLLKRRDDDRRPKERSETEDLRLEAIKKQILQKLGLSAKPNVTHSLPKEVVMEMLSMTNEKESNDENKYSTTTTTTSERNRNYAETVDVDDFYGRTSEIISFAEQGSWVNQNRLLEFQVSPEGGSQMGQDFRVREASLWLKADLKKTPSRCRTTDVYVFKIISNRLPESVTLSSKQFDRLTTEPVKLTLEESKSGWQKIDVTEMVRDWFAESTKDKLRLFVDCACCSHWHIHLFNENRDRDKRSSNNRPFLVIYTDPNPTKRVRRRAIDCSQDSGNQCCKQEFEVRFKDLGWEDWVIAPQGYYANYCRGDCGHQRTPDTFLSYHSQVIEAVRKSQDLSGMTPCCAPLKFSSVSLIYYGPESTIIKRDLPKMVVEECGCP